MANNRIFWPMQAVGIRRAGSAGWIDADVVRGAQSVSMSTNFNLIQVQQLGQLELYDNQEERPEVELSSSKVLDGSPLLYHLATNQAAGGNQTPDLFNRAPVSCDVGLSIFKEEDGGAMAGLDATSSCVMSGMQFTNLTYTFNVGDNFTEQISLVGNDIVFYTDPTEGPSGIFSSTDAPVGDGGVNRRENLIFAYDGGSGVDINGSVADPDATILPTNIFGITTSGTNEDAGTKYGAHINSITVSASTSRDNQDELGRREPFNRPLNYPITITTSIDVTSVSGSRVSATGDGIIPAASTCEAGTNLTDETIRIATCEGTRIYLGTKNKLRSVDYGGGDAGGGNASDTYNYETQNEMVVMHSGDPNGSGTAWWSARGTYLVDT